MGQAHVLAVAEEPCTDGVLRADPTAEMTASAGALVAASAVGAASLLPILTMRAA